MEPRRERIYPGWLMPEEMERERVEARTAMARMMRRHDRYRRRQRIKAILSMILRRPAGGA